MESVGTIYDAPIKKGGWVDGRSFKGKGFRGPKRGSGKKKSPAIHQTKILERGKREKLVEGRLVSLKKKGLWGNRQQ